MGVGDCTVYTITQGSGAGASNTYTFSTSTSNGYSLNVNNALVYSNLGEFPDLIERGDYLETALLLLVLVIVFMSLGSRIFGFSLRYKH